MSKRGKRRKDQRAAEAREQRLQLAAEDLGMDLATFASKYVVLTAGGEVRPWRAADLYLLQQFEYYARQGRQVLYLPARQHRGRDQMRQAVARALGQPDARYVAGADPATGEVRIFDRQEQRFLEPPTRGTATVPRGSRRGGRVPFTTFHDDFVLPVPPARIDGGEVHTLSYPKPQLTEAGRRAFRLRFPEPAQVEVPLGNGSPARITLRQEYFPTIQYGDQQIPRSEVHFVGRRINPSDPEAGVQVVLSFPQADGHRFEAYFADTLDVWKLFPELGEKHARVGEYVSHFDPSTGNTFHFQVLSDEHFPT